MEVETVKLNHLDINRFIETIEVFEDVFEMKNFSMPDREYLHNLLRKDDFFVFAGILENKVVAGLTAYTLQQYYSKKPLAYIYDLAVKTVYQRRGIGKQLVERFNQFCREKGYEEVFVQADKVDDYAIDFYRTTRPTAEEEVVHFYYVL